MFIECCGIQDLYSYVWKEFVIYFCIKVFEGLFMDEQMGGWEDGWMKLFFEKLQVQR